jgi:hypothetical protein
LEQRIWTSFCNWDRASSLPVCWVLGTK